MTPTTSCPTRLGYCLHSRIVTPGVVEYAWLDNDGKQVSPTFNYLHVAKQWRLEAYQWRQVDPADYLTL